MSNIEVNIPPFSESVSEGTIAAIYKHEGQSVNRDENLADVETDKVMLELPSPCAGVIKKVLIKTGDTVKANQPAFIIDTSAKAEASTQQESFPAISTPSIPKITSDEKVAKAMPAAEKILNEKGISASSVEGSGKDGRILKQDALNASLQSAELIVDKSGSFDRVEEVVPMTRLRKRIAERLLDSQRQNAILTTFNEVNMQSVIDLRTKYKTLFEKQYGIKLGFMGFFVKAAVYALKRFPILNASVDGDNIIYHGYFDIGVAIGSPRGLVVPIIRDADTLSLAEIEIKIADFGKRAAEGKLSIDELSGGTYTISNGGTFGSMLSTPIINPPQSAILGMHATKLRPVVEDGQVVVRPMMYLAQSYDHRIIDGREAVLSLVAIKDALEDPSRMVLDI